MCKCMVGVSEYVSLNVQVDVWVCTLFRLYDRLLTRVSRGCRQVSIGIRGTNERSKT